MPNTPISNSASSTQPANNHSTLPENSVATPRLNKVEPKKTLVFKSMLCERLTASLRNKTVDDIDMGDIAIIGYRYLQNKRAQSNSKLEAIAHISMATGHITAAPFTFGVTALGAALHLVQIPPNLGNTGRYRKTKRVCKEILIERLGIGSMQKIQKLKYAKDGLQDLKILMESKDINCEELNTKVIKDFKRRPLDCWSN